MDQVDKVVDEWIKKWERGCFSSDDIRNAWDAWLPEIVVGLGEITMDVKKVLKNCSFFDDFVSILEKFIFYGYSTNYVDHMCKREDVTTCDKTSIFNDSLCFIKCAECQGKNGSRTLCAECFENSEHRGHKYTLESFSFGYCCCGETGTWENTWNCKNHTDLSCDNYLPRDVVSRATIVFETIVRYIDGFINCYRNIDTCDYEKDDQWYVTVYGNFKCMPCEALYGIIGDILGDIEGDVYEYSRDMVMDGEFTVKLSKNHREGVIDICKTKDSMIKLRIYRQIDELIHEEFIYGMLIYLRKCLRYGKELRKVFSKLMLTPNSLSNRSVTEHFFVFSAVMPKRFLLQVDELLLVGMMKEYEAKASLAKMIIERYDVIMAKIALHEMRFTNHLYLFQCRLFRIPNLAYQFIAYENALSVILTAAFNSIEKNYRRKKLNDSWEYNTRAFKQSTNHLDVVEILLRAAPKVWTKELRLGFLNGLASFLRVLNIFQEIDSQTRETENYVGDVNVNYDEGADFQTGLISSSLSNCTSLFLQWCESDSEISSVAYEETLQMITQRICLEPGSLEKTVEFLTYKTKCLPYDSEIHPVSVYLPLFRFLVSLIGILRRNCDVLLEATVMSKMFDSVLKIQVMLAQFTAGMWERNGDSVETRYNVYRTCSFELIFDCDILLLQMVASVTDSNEFLMQILEKYGLIDWFNPGGQESIEHLEEDEAGKLGTISEQFLHLIIMVLIERYVPEVSDVTHDDRLKYDIIQYLCIKPTARSQLVPSVETFWTTETNFNNAIEEIAIFKKPTSVGENGTLELKKEFFERYNTLYSHYDREDTSTAKEYQRQRRKAAGESECFPPPALPKLKWFFVPMLNIFQCDVMLHIMRTVLERCMDLESKCSETELHNVLYLIGYALQEEQSGRYTALTFIEKAAKWKLFDCLEKLVMSNHEDLPKALLQWTMRKYNEVARITTNTANEDSVTPKILKRNQTALARREVIMEEMIQKQKRFVVEHSAYEEEETESDDDEKTCVFCQENQKLGLMGDVLVMLGYVQLSSVLCVQRQDTTFELKHPLLTSNLGPANYTSSCGHVTHAKCLQPYLVKSWEDGDEEYLLGFDAEKQEFLCPLCESLCNVALPLLPPLSSLEDNQITLSDSLTSAIQNFAAKYECENPLQVWKSLAYTVHVTETLLRDSNKPILGHLSSRQCECLDNFVKISRVMAIMCQNDVFYTSYAKNLRLLLSGEADKLNSHLRLDVFGLLVTLIFSENLFGTNRFLDFRLVFVAEIVKILMVTNFGGMIDDVKPEVATPFKNILELLGKNLDHVSETFVWTYVQRASLPFLRRCVLFFSFLSDVSPPVELTQSGGDTFSNMCSYLNFPQTREELFDMAQVYPHVQNWLRHPDVADYIQNGGQGFGPADPHHINQLIELPHEYFEIVRKVQGLKCPNRHNEGIKDPHICLICNEIVCSAMCCYETVNDQFCESLILHLEKCRGGLYLQVDTSEIVIRNPITVNSCCIPGPYLDDYYETDDSLSNPLYLSPEKYKQLHVLWLSHGILEKFSRLARIDAEEFFEGF